MRLRVRNLERLRGAEVEVLVVGGGINGAVAAACLAARGVRVALVDRGDFAGGTSQESSNLAWGGIKYLENVELGLVRELCVSRNHLLRSFPSTVQEIRFLTVHERGFRHGRLKLFLGTLLYWLLGSLFTRRPRLFSRAELARREPALALGRCDGGFEYSDAFLHDNDARFVWGFIRTAIDHDCVAANYVSCEGAAFEGGAWRVRLRDVPTGDPLEVRARVLVNACGPWVDALNGVLGTQTRNRHVFSKGIHLIVPRIAEARRVLTFFADDGRLFFAIPMGPRTCIGTTDTRVGAPETTVTPDDRAFVLRNINERLSLAKPLDESDIVAERCGVRPLVTKAEAAAAGEGQWFDLSRKHVIEVDTARSSVSVFGGKLTDCVNVGEEIFEAARRLGVSPTAPEAAWYGEPPEETRREFFHKAQLMRLDELTAERAREVLSSRLWRRYGARAFPMLEAIREDPAMAEAVIEDAEYLRCELEHTARHEMVVKLDDFLRRRSKIALVVRREDTEAAEGLREACRILFGPEADKRWQEHFCPHTPP